MKKLILSIAVAILGLTLMQSTAAFAYNFGDYRSETLTSKAWKALDENDLEAVLAYTNKAVEMYDAQAQKMQADLNGYIEGDKQDVFNQWALNDLGTAMYIQGEAYRKAGMMKEAKIAYQTVIDKYGYAQTWDNKGWFWKPAEAAKEKLAMMEAGVDVNFGDYTSEFLTSQAWKALVANDTKTVEIYTDKVIELYKDEAQKMQASLDEYPWETKEDVFKQWALNDVGTSLYIKGEALKRAGRVDEAKEIFQTLVDDFYYAQTWDPQGWFWKPAEAAQQELDELEG